jgi:hypothetical protein
MNTPNAAPATAPTPTPSTPSSSPGTSSTPSTSSSNSRPQSISADEFRAKVMSSGGTSDDTDIGDDSPVEFADDNVDESVQNEESPVDDTEPEIDDSWLQDLRDYKEIHGLSAKDILSALAEGNIPDALLEKIQIDLKDGEETWRVPLSEARNGAMRASKFSKKMAALADERNTFAQERDAFGQERDQLVGMLKNWQSDPKALLNGMRKLGLPVEDAARAFAEELHALEQMGPGARELYMEKQKAEMELQELKQRQQWYESQHTQNELRQKEATIKQQTEQDVTYVQDNAREAFRAVGMRITKGSWGAFLSNLNPLWASEGKLSPQIIQEAVRATKEDVDAYVQQHRGAATKPAAPKVARLDPGAPNKISPQAKPRSISSDEFRKRIFNR